MEICAHTPDPPVNEAWGWWGKSLLMQALEHPHTSSRQAGPSPFPSISFSIAPPDLVTGCSCPLPLTDPSAQAHPCQVSASPQHSEVSPKLLHSGPGKAQMRVEGPSLPARMTLPWSSRSNRPGEQGTTRLSGARALGSGVSSQLCHPTTVS